MIPYSVSVPITRQTLTPASLRGSATLPSVDDAAPPSPVEQLAVIDQAGRVVGSAPRAMVRRHNLPHLVVAVLVRDPAGRVYVHRRTDTKDVFPGMHDCFAAGSLKYGEEPAGAAAREVEEELGVTGVPLTPVFSVRYDDDRTRHVCHAFEAVWDGPVTHQPEEVAWGAWMTLDELRAHLADPSWPFVPDGRALVETWLASGADHPGAVDGSEDPGGH
jgi:8-oxo-dGTP pyrophosphatase MutT (NUDIX family)